MRLPAPNRPKHRYGKGDREIRGPRRHRCSTSNSRSSSRSCSRSALRAPTQPERVPVAAARRVGLARRRGRPTGFHAAHQRVRHLALGRHRVAALRKGRRPPESPPAHVAALPPGACTPLVIICVRDPGSLPIDGIGRPAVASSGRASRWNFVREFCNGPATGGWVIGRGHESGHHAGSGPGSGGAGRGPRAGGDPGGGGRGPGRDHPGVPGGTRIRGNRGTRSGRMWG